MRLNPEFLQDMLLVALMLDNVTLNGRSKSEEEEEEEGEAAKVVKHGNKTTNFGFFLIIIFYYCLFFVQIDTKAPLDSDIPSINANSIVFRLENK